MSDPFIAMNSGPYRGVVLPKKVHVRWQGNFPKYWPMTPRVGALPLLLADLAQAQVVPDPTTTNEPLYLGRSGNNRIYTCRNGNITYNAQQMSAGLTATNPWATYGFVFYPNTKYIYKYRGGGTIPGWGETLDVPNFDIEWHVGSTQYVTKLSDKLSVWYGGGLSAVVFVNYGLEADPIPITADMYLHGSRTIYDNAITGNPTNYLQFLFGDARATEHYYYDYETDTGTYNIPLDPKIRQTCKVNLVSYRVKSSITPGFDTYAGSYSGKLTLSELADGLYSQFNRRSGFVWLGWNRDLSGIGNHAVRVAADSTSNTLYNIQYQGRDSNSARAITNLGWGLQAYRGEFPLNDDEWLDMGQVITASDGNTWVVRENLGFTGTGYLSDSAEISTGTFSEVNLLPGGVGTYTTPSLPKILNRTFQFTARRFDVNEILLPRRNGSQGLSAVYSDLLEDVHKICTLSTNYGNPKIKPTKTGLRITCDNGEIDVVPHGDTLTTAYGTPYTRDYIPPNDSDLGSPWRRNLYPVGVRFQRGHTYNYDVPMNYASGTATVRFQQPAIPTRNPYGTSYTNIVAARTDLLDLEEYKVQGQLQFTIPMEP